MKSILVAICLVLFAPVVGAAEPYPINQKPIGGSLGTGAGEVHLAHDVKTSVRTDGKTVYTYTYQISFTGREDMLFQWTILDRVLSGRYAFPHIFKIQNGKTYEFSLVTDEAPVDAPGEARLFRKSSEKILNETQEDNWRVHSSAVEVYILSPGGGHEGPLPLSVLRPLE